MVNLDRWFFQPISGTVTNEPSKFHIFNYFDGLAWTPVVFRWLVENHSELFLCMLGFTAVFRIHDVKLLMKRIFTSAYETSFFVCWRKECSRNERSRNESLKLLTKRVFCYCSRNECSWNGYETRFELVRKSTIENFIFLLWISSPWI